MYFQFFLLSLFLCPISLLLFSCAIGHQNARAIVHEFHVSIAIFNGAFFFRDNARKIGTYGKPWFICN